MGLRVAADFATWAVSNVGVADSVALTSIRQGQTSRQRVMIRVRSQ